MELNIETIAKWSEPKKVNTKNGPRILRVASPTQEFSNLWNSSSSNKAALQAAGLGWSKDQQTNAWTICWWIPDNETIIQQEEAINASKATDSKIKIPSPAKLAYLPYQKAGIEFALNREGTLIGDEMGLGKTIQALGVINADSSIKTVLIVCPASLKLNWLKESKAWLTRAFRIATVSGTEWDNKANFVIINYDVVAKNHQHIHAKVWDLVILDEGHYCKNPKAQRTIALFGKWDKDPEKIKPAVKAKRKIVLTGTPILNRPIEAQPVLGFLSPKEFGNFWRFATHYCGAYQGQYGWDFTGATNLDELQRKLRTTIMVRRMKKDVLKELPPKRRQVIEIPSDSCSALIKREQDGIVKWEKDLANLRDIMEMAKLLEDQDAYAEAVAELRHAQGVAFEEMAAVRHAIALEKVSYVVEHLSNTEEPVVLFAHHRDVVERLINELTKIGKRCVKVIGGMTDQAKQAAVDAFQAGKADVFVGNIKAAGVGITLTRSSHVVFAELDWVPANMSQAEDRTHRIGQTESVLVQHLVLEGSLDQRMATALVNKQDIADKSLDNALTRLEQQEPVSAVTISPVKAKVSEYTTAQINEFLSKLRYLASVCDGALEIDGSGFNKFDSRFGKMLAAQSTLSPKQAAVAEKLCIKYRQQLTHLR
jgi:SNF2 family DNA or RNA helicase